VELNSEFVVAAAIDEVWSLLTDVERIAPCIPGFQLQEIEGNEYRGLMKVKVGAVVTEYRASVEFVEQDASAHRAVMRGSGRETKGQGSVDATITSTLSPDGDRTRATMVTSVNVTGRVAQFGRGILADVSNKLVGQFVECLESRFL
jgi:uncharacterized protein